MTNVVVSVPADVVFPGLDTSFESFSSIVRSLSRTDVLFWGARLNLVLSNPAGPENLEIQRWAVSRFFAGPELARLDQFARDHRGAENVVVFSRAQLLELMRWTCLLGADQPEDGVTFEDPDVRRRFAQAAMLAGDIWIARTYADGLAVSNSKDRGADRIAAMHTFRRAIAANQPATELMRGLARCTVIYDREFGRHHATFEADFLTATGLRVKEYAAFACAMLSDFCAVTPETADQKPGMFKRDTVGDSLAPAAAAAVPHFLALESQSPDELRSRLLLPDGSVPGPMDPFDLKPLWERPILVASDGRSIVMDPMICAEKTWVGPLFHLAGAHRQDSSRVNQLFTAFGNGFEVYVQGLLSHMWKETVPNPSRDDRGKQSELADAGVVLNESLLLFEAKGVFVRDDVTQRPAGYVEELRGKYVQKPGKAATPKGVGQLARGIRRIVADDYLAVAQDLATVRLVYPILVVRDASMTTPGHVEFLAPEFVKALQPDATATDGYMSVGRFRVAPLTVITIENLEDLESSVESFHLPRFLDEYSRQGVAGARPSLHEFMVSVQHRYRIIYSREVARIAVDKMKEVGRFLFAERWAGADADEDG